MKCIDGPAAGVNLLVRRASILLRVVCSASGKWDALDQVDDSPKADEVIFLYRMEKFVGRAFVCVRGKGGGGGAKEMADYKFMPEQPSDADMRDSKRWLAWCETNKERLLADCPVKLESDG